ncbi:pyridoxamine 5'-phosphate oxidase family protein [Galbitalea soli]|uniref:Pyridoxamine 5'-phosphate oxidase family protein n=1 Tax=Galbitalea soli TaxID=1268042 RepID=A0A7C9TPV4_9MICO|nr:pyridoxamine 5'-phosphate oxidase family protein [Galbitalea soli]NEM90481.1 pyridoxamine 5'-phosphate oxidase family protein [Galbitalea soli]NYJ31193.1 hypothetical protein [Galbitalea soli]
MTADPSHDTPTAHTIEEVPETECWELLAGEKLGRLAVLAKDGVDIYPVNYVVSNGAVYFRSAPGQKLVDVTASPFVAFEVDGVHERRRWSVVVRGDAERLAFDSEIHASGIALLKSQAPTEKWNYVRISPKTITGRRFTSR